MKSVSWRQYHEMAAHARMAGKRGPSIVDLVKDYLNAHRGEGCEEELMKTFACNMSGVDIRAIDEHWEEIVAALTKEGEYIHRRDGKWYSARRGRQMKLK